MTYHVMINTREDADKLVADIMAQESDWKDNPTMHIATWTDWAYPNHPYFFLFMYKVCQYGYHDSVYGPFTREPRLPRNIELGLLQKVNTSHYHKWLLDGKEILVHLAAAQFVADFKDEKLFKEVIEKWKK
jgi:hypothetical protein